MELMIYIFYFDSFFQNFIYKINIIVIAHSNSFIFIAFSISLNECTLNVFIYLIIDGHFFLFSFFVSGSKNSCPLKGPVAGLRIKLT